MRIVLSNASHSWGGVHRVTEELARGLGERGHELLVLCRPGSPLEGRLAGVAPTAAVLRGMDLGPAALWRVARELRRFRPDVALLLMKKDVRLTGPVARALGVPVVVRHANDRPLRDAAYHRLLYGGLPALHVANSRATRRTLLASAPWLDAARVAVVHNGIRAEEVLATPPADLGLPAGALAIGFVGRFDERKGVLDLADAWPAIAERVPTAHLVLAGSGAMEAPMRERLAGRPRVHWLGYRADAVAVLRALDLLVVPSHWEGFGLVALEGLAAGLPVVAADASSLPEIVREGLDGRLVPPAHPRALADAVAELAADPAERGRLREAALRRAAEFDVPSMLDRYESLLASVAGGDAPIPSHGS